MLAHSLKGRGLRPVHPFIFTETTLDGIGMNDKGRPPKNMREGRKKVFHPMCEQWTENVLKRVEISPHIPLSLTSNIEICLQHLSFNVP